MDIQTGQVVRGLGAMESLETQLSCPICLEMFTKPVVILPCQHNLCRGCANDLYESKNLYRYSGGTFRCPTCRFEVVLDRHGVHGLQRNLLVENIIDMYKQQRESQGGEGGEDPPPKDRDAKEPMCDEHEDERINIYCVTCSTPTCSMCKVFGQHKDCEVSPLHAIYQAQKSELRAAVEQLAAADAQVAAAAVAADEACERIRESGDLQRRRLGESFDLLFATLEQRKGQLVERVGEAERSKVTSLKSLAERYRLQLQAGGRLREKLEENLRSSSAAEFLLAAGRLREEAREAVGGGQPQGPEPGYESMEHLSVDTQEAELLLAGLDFRTAGVEDQ
ncbi:E3 ubiquitin-protein ligase TRIM63-like [Pungitius pungitius]|uniref:E3 ubiquitin-protein ligase TRIM63-like n=1 Tax=Pungitius pungitius TaxID=134920 RepID=UPI002E0F6738